MSHDQLLETSQRVSVRPATSTDDLHRDRIAALRYKGYRCLDSVTSALDDLGFAASCLLLVAGAYVHARLNNTPHRITAPLAICAQLRSNEE